MMAEQEAKLAEMGYVVRNGFLDGPGPTTFGEAVRRANSDPTPSSSSSREPSSDSIRQSGGLLQVTSSQTMAPTSSQQATAEALHRLDGEELAKLRERAAVKGLDLEEQVAHVPLDQEGRLTSIGSKAHSSGACKPCAFSEVIGSPAGGGVAPGCLEGVLCRFCHFQHASKPKIRLRPCKSRRDRMRKLVNKVTDNITQDGQEYDVSDANVMPEWIQRKPLLLDHVQSVVAFRVAKTRGAPLDVQEQLSEPVEVSMEDPRAVSRPSPAASSSAMFSNPARVPPGVHMVAHTDGLADRSITRFSL